MIASPGKIGVSAADSRTVDPLYETDFYTWTQRQSALIQAGRLEDVDVINIVEEIETLGRSEAAALESSYRLIAMHILKMIYQPGKATPSWAKTIGHERIRLARTLRQNPGLKAKREALFASAYEDARKEAGLETGLPRETFPQHPPFTVEQIESERYEPMRPDSTRRTET